jgi:hypothetical protein
MHRQQLLVVHPRRLAPLVAAPVAPLELGLDRPDAVRPLGVAAAGVVL